MESVETLVQGTQPGVELEFNPGVSPEPALPTTPHPLTYPGLENKEPEPCFPEELSNGSPLYGVVKGAPGCVSVKVKHLEL